MVSLYDLLLIRSRGGGQKRRAQIGNQNRVNKARGKVTQRAAQQRGARPDSAPKVLSWAPNPGALKQGTTS
jgi:hypothetical protein